ncbi:MAG: hypothetical protein GYB66_06305 [Chloroflexi bacterium]|nr:hypothetical protein [Chloroflexota bacterium]
MTISNHPHPRQRLQRLIGCFTVSGMLLTVLGVAGLLVLGIGYGLFLMVLMVPFLLGLALPLFLLTSLHPSIAVEEGGLRLRPLVFAETYVAWDKIEAMTPHTLVKPPPPSKLRRKAQTGVMFVARPGALPAHYRVVGMLSGHGFKPVFAISDRTHQDYEHLKQQIERYIKKGNS